LEQLIQPDEVRSRARLLGAVQRQRKVDVYELVLAVVVAVCGRGGQSFADMRRGFVLRGGQRLARSAFWRRFTPGFAALVTWLASQLQQRAANAPQDLPGVLASFRDVIAADATVIKVHDALADVWPGTCASRLAAIKVHTWVRVLTGELLHHRITKERYGDGRAFGVNWDAAGKLFLFDRGYPSASMWWRIHRVGGFFLTRLPGSYQPKVHRELREHRGRARRLQGKRLREATVGLRRKYVDVTALFRVRIRKHGGWRGRYVWPEFRIVGVFHAKRRAYDFFVTNVPAERLPAEAIPAVYRLRWEVETFYKTGKSGLGLHELHSRKKHVVETLVTAALVRATLAMQAKLLAERRLPRGLWINPGQWITVWRRVVDDLADLRRRRRLPTWSELARLAADPNLGRVPLRQRFRRGLDVRGCQWA
jgi:hypothetical protein